MPLDAVTVCALTEELSKTCIGAKIDKVQQPERDMLIFHLRMPGANRKLLVSAGSGNARVHLTSAVFENPAEPPMFCMLLRKHLTGARIISIVQPGFERLICFELETFDELGISARKKLVAELMGRNSNLVLVGADGIIIDCLRRMSFAGDNMRCLQPGMLYRLPPAQKKTDFFSSDIGIVAEKINKADTDLPPEKWLMDTFSGLSPLICRELSFRADESFSRLLPACERLKNLVDTKAFSPCILTENGKPRDFCFDSILQYGGRYETVFFESFSQMLDGFYAERDRLDQQHRRSSELRRKVKTIRDRIQRKLASQYDELSRSEDRESVRRAAELITANIYRIKKGQTFFECENYYEENCPLVRIDLDPLKTPQQNSAALFKQYNKLKGAHQHLTVLIAQNEMQLDYLNSVLNEIDLCESEKDISDIRAELANTGYLKNARNAGKSRAKPQLPNRYLSDDGYEILVGKNNTQNDELTFKSARRTDYWLHVQKVHGSHVIIRCDGTEPPERTIEQAAELAAFYSQNREAGKTAVDYTMIRNVRKPAGALPGKVIYTDYSTVLVQPEISAAKK